MEFLTGQIALVGGVALTPQAQGGVLHTTPAGTLSRTNTTDHNLFSFPANAIPVGFLAFSAAGSNAGTTAIIDVGPQGSDTGYVNAASVLGAAGAGLFIPANQAGLFTTVGAEPQPVVGKYAETGTASSAGGPWTIVGLYRY